MNATRYYVCVGSNWFLMSKNTKGVLMKPIYRPFDINSTSTRICKGDIIRIGSHYYVNLKDSIEIFEMSDESKSKINTCMNDAAYFPPGCRDICLGGMSVGPMEESIHWRQASVFAI